MRASTTRRLRDPVSFSAVELDGQWSSRPEGTSAPPDV